MNCWKAAPRSRGRRHTKPGPYTTPGGARSGGKTAGTLRGGKHPQASHHPRSAPPLPLTGPIPPGAAAAAALAPANSAGRNAPAGVPPGTQCAPAPASRPLRTAAPVCPFHSQSGGMAHIKMRIVPPVPAVPPCFSETVYQKRNRKETIRIPSRFSLCILRFTDSSA